jgi:hypothetical protein
LASSQVKPLGFQIPPRDYPPTTAAPKTFRPPQLTPEPRAAYPTDSSDENAAHASYRQQANPASARKVAAPPPATKTYLPPLRTKAPPPPPPPDDEGEEGNEEQPPIRRQPQEADAPILKFPLFKRTAQVPTGNDEESEIPIPPPPAPQGIDLAGLAKRKKEISGEAQLSQEEDDDIEAPRPPSQADSIPAAEQYGEAKEGFKRKLEQMELKEKAKGSSDEMIEEYAKENITWLYEIYKMGGMEREDFLAEARENMAPSGPKREQEGEPPPNPALEALSKEIEKKKKQE